MTQSRATQVSLVDTPYYHCISRCVRRAFLCGKDKFSGQSFEHRRQWMVERLQFLTSIFTIDTCAYAIMSNHYHLVLHVNELENSELNDEEVCLRWSHLYSMPTLVSRWQAGAGLSEEELLMVKTVINKWRERLMDISWFMRSINEFIARKANKEDNCAGRFWEGRFKSQALLDENALLTCMAYVDLNPIRAKMASSIECSEYTSVHERIHGNASKHMIVAPENRPIKPLYGFVGDKAQQTSEGIPFSLIDYFELLDWTSRVLRDDKRGVISGTQPQLLDVLGIDDEAWCELASSFGKNYQGAVGSLEELASYAEHTGKCWIAKKNVLHRSLH
ncbi:transposase [Psychromonas sp. MB-3u-54]|uniref:transposase n=1 Tax=Psychromonas sp. MB-3u-54 TaxID=2058319 RepID=UPI000C31BE83|nr:transposase [Psychromonas sp. MB-3u-54]PKH02136.1 transposase [Psychromonas sp. MB-3u-54]